MIGYLVFKECFGLSKPGRDRRTVITEYPVGMELPVYHSTPDMELFVSEGVVSVLDANRKPTTWEALFPPEQKQVFVPKVKATTRPVKVKK
jgi:hypothetical protein